jgi:LmbE family N-acetylglucosaminyl deacetylase
MTLAASVSASPHTQASASDIAAGLRRLSVVGSVLYVAAHPDDENTRLLAWLVGQRGVRAGYLSLTRGDGGQNLIGTEQDELLGLLRTQELLAARRIDGAEQLFTRARDFGYSKSAEETLAAWGHEEVLHDVVLAIRRFRPDVIVTRFTPDPPNHGHHTASALLAAEGFAVAADRRRFTKQLAHEQPWQADRLLHNISTWRMAPNADMSRYMTLDVGSYDPLSGRSWGEVAARSRSEHKSQGFGSAAERGPVFEYFVPLAGTRPEREPFEGLDFSWRRFAGTEQLVGALEEAERSFELHAPHKSLAALRRVYEALEALPLANPWREPKLREVEALLAACAGLFLEVRAAERTVAPGGKLEVSVKALNRSPASVRLIKVELPYGKASLVNKALAEHSPLRLERSLALPSTAPVTTPYWLERPAIGGRYDVPDLGLIGRPEAEAPLSVTFLVEIEGARYSIVRPVMFGWVDPVRGELANLVEVAPHVTAELDRDVVMVPNLEPQTLTVRLLAGSDGAKGAVALDLPPGWRATPSAVPFELVGRGAQRAVSFTVTPPARGAQRGRLRAVVTVAGRPTSWTARSVTHEHIPPQTVRAPAEATLVPLVLATGGKRIGYVPGPGDRVAESLAAVGYDITLLPEERLAKEPLERYDAILIGVRAFNASPKLAAHKERLLAYVAHGGKVVVQYNTNNRLGPLTLEVGPYPLEVGRERVTDESAAMHPVVPDDAVLRAPNLLEAADYEGWLQERGLYFASSWDPRYQPIFRMGDPGEEPHEGALLVASHGEGTFVYTGLSFFRQLPAGVPGAYRLLANVLAR